MDRGIVIVMGLALLLSCGSRVSKNEIHRDSTNSVLARLSLRMNQIGIVLAKEGFIAERGETHGYVAPMEKVVVALSSSKRRILAVVIGEEGGDPPDIDIHIMTADGATVAEDLAPDLRSAVTFWADPAEEYLAELSTKNGQGQFLLRLFSSSEATASVALAGLFDADPVMRRSFDSAKSQARSLGFKTMVAIQKKTVRQGERLTFPIREKSGRCYLFGATGTSGIDTMEARLLHGDRLLSADFQSRPEAWLQHCAEEDQEVQAFLKVQAGSGAVTVGWFEASREEVIDIMGPPLHTVSPSPDLDNLTAAAQNRLISAGHIDIQSLTDQYLTAGDRVSLTFQLEEGQCASVLGVVEGLEDVDLEISKEGVAVALDRSATSVPQTGICANRDTTYHLAIIAIKGQGRVRALLSYLPEIDLPLLPDPLTVYTARKAAAEFKRASLMPRTEAQNLAPDEAGGFKTPITLEQDQCYGVAVISSSALSAVSIGGRGTDLVASWMGRSLCARLTLCPAETGEYLVEAVPAPDADGTPPYLLVFESGHL